MNWTVSPISQGYYGKWYFIYHAGQKLHILVHWFSFPIDIQFNKISSFLVQNWERSTTRFFNFNAEYIMQNARLDESQTGIRIARRNINFRYEGDATLMAESKGELKSILMRVKEESEKSWLEIQHSKN